MGRGVRVAGEVDAGGGEVDAMRQNKPKPAIPKQHGRMGKLQFTSSVAVKWSGRGMVSVPALPYRGYWAVTRLNE